MEWISIKDRLPEINKKVLCYYYNEFMDVMEYWYDEDGKHVFFNPPAPPIEDVTHWAELPQPPKE